MASASFGALVIGILAVTTNALSPTLMEDVQRADQVLRPKTKRAQELLMFGNQQNRQAENVPANLFSMSPEKRTLGSSELDEIKSVFPSSEKFSRTKPLASAMQEMYEEKHIPQYYKGYQYGQILDNQLEDARNWDVPAYPRYYSTGDDRRKRSDGTSIPATSTHAPISTPAPVPTGAPRQKPVPQVKRSLPLYQEPRYKRDLDPQDVVALLSVWEAERREGRNWPGYEVDEYDNVDDENNFGDLEEEDPRSAGGWLEGPVYTPRHFSVGGDVLGSPDIGIPRTRPANYYDRYGTQYGQQYGGALYGAPQYSTGYARNDYAPEKRFMVSKKRSQGYRPYDGRSAIVNLAQLLGTLPQGYGYPNDRLENSYYHRLNL